jgi:hypothetical protein
LFEKMDNPVLPLPMALGLNPRRQRQPVRRRLVFNVQAERQEEPMTQEEKEEREVAPD